MPVTTLPRRCADCNADISNRGPTAKRCEPCALEYTRRYARERYQLCEAERIKRNERRRAQIAYRSDPRCCECNAPVERKVQGRRAAERCPPCAKRRRIARERKRRGYVDNPTCSDCGLPVTRINGRNPPQRCPACKDANDLRRAAAATRARRRNNPEATRAADRRHHRKRGNYRRHLIALIVRQLGRCYLCKRQLPEDAAMIHVDHVVPVAKDGTSDVANLRAVCAACNMKKRTRLLDPKTNADQLRLLV